MKKFIYVLLALIAFLVNSTGYAIEARVPSTSITQAIQSAKSKDNFAVLKNVKFDVKEKAYTISYLTKDGSVETLKISKVTGKEVK